MKWNISKIKHHRYEVLNLQVCLLVLVLTHGNVYGNSGGFFAKKI